MIKWLKKIYYGDDEFILHLLDIEEEKLDEASNEIIGLKLRVNFLEEEIKELKRIFNDI